MRKPDIQFGIFIVVKSLKAAMTTRTGKMLIRSELTTNIPVYINVLLKQTY